MKHGHFLAAIAALIVAGAPATSLGAQSQRPTRQGPGNADVTLRVPLQLQNLNPAATGAIVYCESWTKGGGAHAWAQDSVPLAQGGYNGTVDVKLSLLVSQPGVKWDYTCQLSFYNATLKTSSGPGMAPWAMAKTGTTPVSSVSGSVTTQ